MIADPLTELSDVLEVPPMFLSTMFTSTAPQAGLAHRHIEL